MFFFSISPVLGAAVPKISSKPIYCPAAINPYTLRPLTGLHGDQMLAFLVRPPPPPRPADALLFGCLWY